jgi:ribosome-binding protein aMBF1 (putative translation factor)
MNPKQRKKMTTRGWKIGGAKEFLGLSDEESTLIDFKLALADSLKSQRIKRKMSQVELAKLLTSSQSRVAKMESADHSVSLDLILRALLRLGASPKQIANAIALV